MKPCQRWDHSSWQNGCFSNTFIFSICPNPPGLTPMLIPKNALDFTKEGTMLPLQKAQRATWKTFGTFVTFGCLSTRGLLHLCNLCTRMKIIIWWKWLKFIKLMRIFPNLLSLTAKKNKASHLFQPFFCWFRYFSTPPPLPKKKQTNTRFGKPSGFLRGLVQKNIFQPSTIFSPPQKAKRPVPSQIAFELKAPAPGGWWTPLDSTGVEVFQ